MTPQQWAVLGTAAVLVFWMVGAYNRLVRLRQAIVAAWVQFDEQLRRRGAVMPPLVAALQSHLADEQDALEALLAAEQQVQSAAEAVRTKPARAPAAAGLVTAEGVLGSALSRLAASIEQHAALREDAAIGAALMELRDIDLHLSLARRGFNTVVQNYNDAVRQFPTRFLAHMFAFERAGLL